MSAPLNPLSHQRSDKPCTRTIARDPVQGFGLLGGQPDLDADPAILARLLGRDLRFASFGHGSGFVACPRAIKIGGSDQTLVVCVARRTRNRSEPPAALNNGEWMPMACGVLNRRVNCCSFRGPFSRLHHFLRGLTVRIIWEPHTSSQWGSHIYFGAAA